MTVEHAYQILYGGALIILILLIGAMVIRSIIGPRSTDRIMSVNMLGTMPICSLAILSVLLDEETAAGDGKEVEQTDERASARR